MPVVAGLVGSAAAFIALLTLAEASARRWHLQAEVGRKLAHVSSAVTAAALPLVLPFPAIAGLAAAFVPFMILSRRCQLFPVLHSAERSTFGEIYFPLGVLAAALLVPDGPAYSFGVLVMGIGDALASLIGQRFGRKEYRVFGAMKTYLGSAALLATTLVLGVLTAAILVGISGNVVLIVIGIAAVITIEEGVFGGGADNVVLPVTAAALLRALI